MIKNKKLLVFLYLKFNGNQNLIIKELLEKNLKATEKDVEKYLKTNKVNLKKYHCFFESDFPNDKKSLDNITLIIAD